MDILEFVKKYDDIIVYGAGWWADRATALLKENGLAIACYCVTEKGRDGEQVYLGRKLIEATSLPNALNDYDNPAILVCVHTDNQSDIRLILAQYGEIPTYYVQECELPTEEIYNFSHRLLCHLFDYHALTETVKISEYENRLAQILTKFPKIEISVLPPPFGSMTAQYLYYQKYYQAGDSFRLLVHPYLLAGRQVNKPATDVLDLPNKVLLKKFCGDSYECLYSGNVNFWHYCLIHHMEVFQGSAKFTNQDLGMLFASEMRKHAKKQKCTFFTKVEEEIGNQEISHLNIAEPYICFFQRESEYMVKFDQRKSRSELEAFSVMDTYRNCASDSFDAMADSFEAMGVTCVRMGKAPSVQYKHKNIVDYAYQGRTDFLDFYINEHCLFFVGDSSGAATIAAIFAKPIITINSMMAYLYDDMPFPISSRSEDLIIYQKYYDKRKGRFMTLKEMIRAEQEAFKTSRSPVMCCSYDIPKYYMQHEIIPVKNTPAEVRDVALEMYGKIQGIEVYDEEDKELQERYREILADGDVPELYAGHIYCPAQNGNCGKRFLKENKWLLADT